MSNEREVPTIEGGEGVRSGGTRGFLAISATCTRDGKIDYKKKRKKKSAVSSTNEPQTHLNLLQFIDFLPEGLVATRPRLSGP